ncbi:hypothetical protein HC725_02030 [Vibrio sp. S17_S38]|uniref:hypothetical protein n=1 Tax=Vibrio sp. S17_S38 TaxID=2720229 RepID=UPI0016814361|nr:hypothetical protein [Vibrio sp. S17_S38]MBD1572057.1 hypothetical protein [Vibrio sp. S17_S38]
MNKFSKALAIDTAIELVDQLRRQTERNNMMFAQYGLIDFDLSSKSTNDKNFQDLIAALSEVKDDVMGAV